MKMKTFSIINIGIVLLFGIYLATSLFVDYPKFIKTIVLTIYFIYAVIRAIFFIRKIKK